MKVTPEKKLAFLSVLAATCNVTASAEAAGIHRKTAYEWRDEDPEFAAAWERAKDMGVEALEDEAHRRAFQGFDKPVYQGGAMVGTVREYSDTLSIFLLKAHKPTRYRENTRMELTGADGGPVQLDDTQAASRAAALLALAKQRKEDDEEPLV
jgi:hypothetical protein